MPTRQSLLQSYQEQLRMPEEQQITIHLNLIEFLCSNPEEAQAFRVDPSSYLKSLHEWLLHSQKPLNFLELMKVTNAQFYLSNIPYVDSVYKNLTEVTADDVGKWMVLTGTVIQCTQKKTLEKTKIFICDQCGYQLRLYNSYVNYHHFEQAEVCPNIVKKMKSNNLFTKFYQNISKRKSKSVERPNQYEGKCGSNKFSPKDTEKVCVDYQEIRIQEQFKHISAGRMPQAIAVILQGKSPVELRPGDDVSVSGLIAYRYKKPIKQQKMQCQMVVVLNYIVCQKSGGLKEDHQQNNRSEESQYADYPLNFYTDYNLTSKEAVIVKQLQFRNEVIRKFCPSIYGRETIKLGLILALLGGVSIQNEHTKIRGQSHVLLIGQPGTGKSVLLKEMAELAERSFFTNGIGTSSAGLSVSYFKNGSDWSIEAGALVLADNGVCCIDELTLLSKKDQHSLLEAMEQQTISSAKASVVGKLNARTTVIGACNPITSNQAYDPSLDLEGNTGLSVPLLTRFDLILILKDEQDRHEDNAKCQFILSKFRNEKMEEQTEKDSFSLKSLLKKCKVYQPELQNGEILSKYYSEQRRNLQKVTTARAFESLCRLTEAHAKLMMRDYTVQLDCLTAIMLVENRLTSTIEEYYLFLDQFNAKYQMSLE